MLIDVTSSKMRNYLFNEQRKERPNGPKYSLRVFKEKPKMPGFIRVYDSNWREQKIGYYLFIEYRDYVAILRKNCVVPKDISFKLEHLDYDKLIALYADKKTEFKKLSMQNLDGSDHAMRFKSYEALDLKDNISPIGSSHYYIRSVNGNNGSERFTLTINASRINNSGSGYTLDAICDWVKETVDKIILDKRCVSDFLNIFAKPVKYVDVWNSLKPSSLLLLFGPIVTLHDDEGAQFYFIKEDRKVLIDDATFRRKIGMTLRCFEEVHYDDNEGKFSYYTGIDNCIEIKILKSGIKLINPEWNNIIIEGSIDGEHDGSLSEIINKYSLFNVYFSDTELIYSNRTLFKDTKLLSSAHHFLEVLKNRIEGSFSCEKYNESSPRGLNDWGGSSIFKYVESNFMQEYTYFICDDCGSEWADHIGISEGRVTFFVEKHKKSQDSASAFQDVVGQALKNLANLIPSESQLNEKRRKWIDNYETSNIPRFRSRRGNVDEAIHAYSGDSRSPIPMISVHSVGDFLYRRQS